MSDALFRRDWKIIVDTLDVSNLPIDFKVLSTLKPEPNKCVLKVLNLESDNRAQLLKRNQPNPNSKKLVGVSVKIDAGYKGNVSSIFGGDLREVASSLDDVDWKTTLSGDDGGRAYREARFTNGGICFQKGTLVSDVLSQCAQAMGVGQGNVANFEANDQFTSTPSALPHTITLSGGVSSQLTRVVNSIGYTWSIQGGALQVLPKGKALNMSAIKLSASTGLLGSPEAAIDSTVSLGSPKQFLPGAKKKVPHPPKPTATSIVRARCLLINGVIPGRAISLDSASVKGDYIITEAEAVGQTWSDVWGYNLVLRVAA